MHPTLPSPRRILGPGALGNPHPRNLIKVVLGTSWGFFWGSKTFFLGLHFLMVFRIHFWWVFGANLGPTWLPISTKINEKSRPRCLRMLTCFFDRFLIDFCSQLRRPEPSKSWFFPQEKQRLFKQSPFEDNIDLGSILEASLVQFCF